jgi:hypothetical protein
MGAIRMIARKERARYGVGDKHRVYGIALEVLAANGAELMDCSILRRNPKQTNKCRLFDLHCEPS